MAYRHRTQRRGHEMENAWVLKDGLVVLQLVHFSAPKTIPKRLVNRCKTVFFGAYIPGTIRKVEIEGSL